MFNINLKHYTIIIRMVDSDSDWSTDDDSDGEIEDTVFDTKAPRPIKISTPVNSAKFHPTNKLFVAGDFDGVIQGEFHYWKIGLDFRRIRFSR